MLQMLESFFVSKKESLEAIFQVFFLITLITLGISTNII